MQFSNDMVRTGEAWDETAELLFFDPRTGEKSDICEDCKINLNITPIFLIIVTTSS